MLRLKVKRLLDSHPLGEHYLARPAVDRHAFDPHGPARGPMSLTSTSGPESFSEDPGAGGDSFETPQTGRAMAVRPRPRTTPQSNKRVTRPERPSELTATEPTATGCPAATPAITRFKGNLVVPAWELST